MCTENYEMDGWIDVDDHLPTKTGRYQVVIKCGDRYHVTMRKFLADKKHWFQKVVYGKWARSTYGIVYWKPMSELPSHLKQYEDYTNVVSFVRPDKIIIRGM